MHFLYYTICYTSYGRLYGGRRARDSEGDTWKCKADGFYMEDNFYGTYS